MPPLRKCTHFNDPYSAHPYVLLWLRGVWDAPSFVDPHAQSGQQIQVIVLMKSCRRRAALPAASLAASVPPADGTAAAAVCDAASLLGAAACIATSLPPAAVCVAASFLAAAVVCAAASLPAGGCRCCPASPCSAVSKASTPQRNAAMRASSALRSSSEAAVGACCSGGGAASARPYAARCCCAEAALE